MNDNQKIMQTAKTMVDQNLSLCCQELVDWSKTAVLTNGIIREIADVVRPVMPTHAMSLVESMVKHTAMEKVASEV